MNPRIVQREIVGDFKDDSLPPLLQRIYAARGVTTGDDINLQLGQLLPYGGLADIDKAVERLTQALEQQQKVLIIGDYDADGATSTALIIRVLQRYGLRNIDYLVPNRFEYGYGLSPAIVEVAMQSQPALIVTVDNGISSIEGVKKAREAGIDVLITDHHLPGEELPDATVIVNPNQLNCSFASKCLAGVGVVFYVMLALRAHLRGLDWFERHSLDEPNLADYLDIVALGTVADVVPLDKNNRILVHHGIRRIRADRTHAGIRALIQISRRDQCYFKSSDLGFAVAPRLNAAGRLDDMSVGIECLLTDDESHAQALATELDMMNMERKQISHTMEKEAHIMLEKLHLEGDTPAAYCLYQPEWHQGVTGILAGRVKEKKYRPTIVFADGQGGELKGSARSISGFHIRDALANIAARNQGIIKKFGGHAMAAGLTISGHNFDVFRQLFESYADAALGPDEREIRISTDGELNSEELNIDSALAIERAGPWGQQFPEPRFIGEFEVVSRRRIGSDKTHLKLVLAKDNVKIDAVVFNVTDEQWPEHISHVRIVFELSVNRYHGSEDIQLKILHIDLTGSG